MFRTFIILDTGSIHPEALNWAERVAANGGTVSDSTLRSVSDFCHETASIRSLFLRLNLFAGNNLNAALVPLYLGEAPGIVYGNSVDTNFNFVAADYTERGTNGGLVGNGVNKYLDTGFIPNSVAAFGQNNSSFSVYCNTNNSGNRDLGCQSGFSNVVNIISRQAGSMYHAINNSLLNSSIADARGLNLINRISSLNYFVYKNSIQLLNPTSTSSSKPTVSTFVYCNNNSGTPSGYTNQRLSSYHLGVGFSATQIIIFYNALQKFQTALNRQV